jgi:hypothetical protein
VEGSARPLTLSQGDKTVACAYPREVAPQSRRPPAEANAVAVCSRQLKHPPSDLCRLQWTLVLRLFASPGPQASAGIRSGLHYLNGSEFMILRRRNVFCAAMIGSLTVATVSRKYCSALLISTLVAFET